MEALEIEEKVKAVLKREEEIPAGKNLLEAGLSSVQIMKLTNDWRKAGYRCTFAQLISNPYVESWAKLLIPRSSLVKSTEKEEKEKEEGADMYQPFPLTDVQYAYWIGRKEGQRLGKVGCHGYLEIDGEGVEPERLGQAWDILQQHHPMLRARFTENGMQQIGRTPYKKGITVYDYRDRDAGEHLKEIRDKLSHRLLDIENGQVAEIQLTLLNNNRTRIHFDIDLLIADVKSYQIILRDLAYVYITGNMPKAPKEWNFAQYLHKEKLERESYVRKAQEYWSERLETLPGKPQLPLAKEGSQLTSPRFTRRKAILEKEDWNTFRQLAAKRGLTPAMALLTLYGEVIARWSQNSDFLMNIPLFNRNSNQAETEDVVADFTTLLLLEMKMGAKDSFAEAAQRVQEQFHRDMEYIDYSGLRLQRDYMKLHPDTDMVAPVVFSCNIGIPLINEEFENTLGHMGYMISQTPQVWLDFQVFDVNEGLLMIWDGVEELFPEGLLEEMFKTFVTALKELAQEEQRWNSPVKLTISEEQSGIHSGFFAFAKREPQKVAVEDEEKGSITYGELDKLARKIAAYLKRKNLKRGDSVGVSCKRGYKQIAAMLGILAAGGRYVTVGRTQPVKRKQIICKKAQIEIVLTDSPKQWEEFTHIDIALLEDMNDLTPIKRLEKIGEEDSAYIIFTSGSTGVPKGVEITHGSAYNTIHALNQMYHVNEKDSVLAISATDFDLSVYDIFGLLSVGGRVVLISEENRKNAAHWCELLERHSVTIWNSVPVLLEMLLLAAEEKKKSFPDLRLAMLSGDWIGLDLPEKLSKLAGNAKFIAMGGATEGAIWSNYQEVTLPIPEQWISIPYGRPLPNQKYRVVNDRGEDCPSWVAGELWIGGRGVAKGYIGEPDLTAEQFVLWEGERWYRTGDYGRFWQDRTIEFLGRRDHQVKVRGHRIELEEIEKAYKKHSGIEKAVVMPFENEQKHKFLVGFVVPMAEENVSFGQQQRLLEEAAICKAQGEADVRGTFQEADINELTQEAQAAESYLKETAHTIMRKLLETVEEKDIEREYLPLVARWREELKKETGQAVGRLKETEALQELKKNMEPFVHMFEKQAHKLLSGKIQPFEFMLQNHFQSMDVLADKLPGAARKLELLCRLAVVLVRKKAGEAITILEVGARKPQLTERLLKELKDIPLVYVLTDPSAYYLQQAQELIRDERLRFRPLDLSDEAACGAMGDEKYDMILAADSLHREKSAAAAVKRLKSLLKAEGILLLAENTRNNPMQLVTAELLEKSAEGIALLDEEEWEDILRGAGLEPWRAAAENDRMLSIYGKCVMAGLCRRQSAALEEGEIASFLRERLPDYMVPENMILLEELPVTDNGKIDRKALKKIWENNKQEKMRTLPKDELEIACAEVWAKVLRVSQVYMEDDFYLLGGDSLVATQLVIEAKRVMNREISLEEIFKNPVFGDFVKAMRSRQEQQLLYDKKYLPQISFDKAALYEPFPMTDIQQAYWIGRSGAYELGDVGVHCYFEMDCQQLDRERLQRAFNMLICRHDMMRAVIMPDGKSQRILKETPGYEIREQIISDGEESGQAQLLSIRNEMAKRVFNAQEWPLFEIRISQLDNKKSRLHLSFDNIVFDGFSIFRLFSEWKKLYQEEGCVLPAIKGSFRDYVLAQEKLKETAQYEEERQYWLERVKTLPLPPQLPMAEQEKSDGGSFTRFEKHMSAEKTRLIQRIAEKYHLTGTVVFLSAYAEILGRYSKSQHFTLNLTRFQKLPLYEGVENLIGDFTTLTLLEIDLRKGNNFLERCKAVGNQLLEAMKYSLVSGVVVEREWLKAQNRTGVAMPIVFTSGFGVNSKQNEASDYMGQIVYGESQTPQVWLDHQISIQDEQLFISWDMVCGLFPPGMPEEMFGAYCELLEALLENSAWEKECPSLTEAPRIAQIERENWEKTEVSGETLLSLFEKSAKAYQNKTAIAAAGKEISYGELEKGVNELAARMILEGVKPEDRVAILMEKGANQIIGALAVLKAGAAYLPVDIHNPKQRVREILQQGDVRLVLVEDDAKEEIRNSLREWRLLEVSQHSPLACQQPVTFPEIKDTQLAYIIFTSGSTGSPKGVMIDHRGAVNTILDVNRRFFVACEDAAIFLSNLNFDLSVYDIFGMLAVGGKVVIPDAHKVKEPSHWITLIEKYHVSVWNSVPAFMQMLVEYNTVEKEKVSRELKLVLLSGDWIPVALPGKLREQFPRAQLVGLGGATEASIWSNYFVIPDRIPKEWKSIPYGKPLANQRYYILNELMDKCPVWVKGELYIAGVGVAKGYFGDEERTIAAFVQKKDTGEIMYRTGDYGRYLPDGNIEFLGREDSQIKRNGHRIECGEVEARLRRLEGVREAAVTAIKGETVELVAHVVLEEGEDNPLYTKISGAEETKLAIEDTVTAPDCHMEAYQSAVSDLSRQMLCEDIGKMGLFREAGECRAWSEILQRSGCGKKGERILQLYLQELVREKKLKKEGVHYTAWRSMAECADYYRSRRQEKTLGELQRLLASLEEALTENRELRFKMLRGEVDAKTLLASPDTSFLTPQRLGQFDPVGDIAGEAVIGVLEAWKERYPKKACGVLELGSRAANHSRKFKEVLGEDAEFTYGDESFYYLEQKKQELLEGAEYRQLNLDEASARFKEKGGYDLILADNTLHRFHNLDIAMENLSRLLLPGGFVIAAENICNMPLMLLTTAYMEDGYEQLRDFRKETGLPMLTEEQWSGLFARMGMQSVQTRWSRELGQRLGKQIFAAQKASEALEADMQKLKNMAQEVLPDYMQPEVFLLYDNFPLSANGKVDRKELTRLAEEVGVEKKREILSPRDELEEQLAGAWRRIIKTEELSIDDNFFASGGDSLKAIMLITALKEFCGYEISLQELFEYPSVMQMAELLRQRTQAEETIELIEGEL